MIHSLSGGVLCDVGIYTFAKVECEEGETAGRRFWYLSEIPSLKEGDEVLVPTLGALVRGRVVALEVASAQEAPYPLNRIRAIERVL